MFGRSARAGTGPPDFIGVGTESAGLGWWHGLLLEHPAIRPPRGGERALRFFSQYWTREMTDADIARYHAHFPRRRGTITGECTRRYLYLPWTPPLIRRAAPDAKVLILVCDPIERYRVRIAQERLASTKEDDVLRMGIAAARGRYATQLRTLTRYVDQDQLLVLQTEKCQADPLGEYRRTLRFLGVPDDFVPRRFRRLAKGRTGPRRHVRAARALGVPAQASRDHLRALVRPGRRGRRQPEPVELWPDIEHTLHEELDSEVRELAAVVPELDLSLWPNFAHLATPSAAAGMAAREQSAIVR